MSQSPSVNRAETFRLINPERLKHSVIGDYLILLTSTLLGVFLGGFFWFIANAVTIIGLLWAIPMVGKIIVTGWIIVPFGATLAGLLNLHYSALWARAVFKLSEPSASDPLGARVLELSRRLGLSTPPATLWMDEINAFAMGSGAENGVIAIGRPLADFMTPDELDAIIGHELGHVVCNDMRRTTFCRAYQEWLSYFLVWRGLQSFVRWVLTPLGEALIMIQSRRREYWADAIGAALTSKEAMINALKKIHAAPSSPSTQEQRYAAFMFKGFADGLFRTHPTLEQRVAALQRETYLSRVCYKTVESDNTPAALLAPSNVTYTDGL